METKVRGAVKAYFSPELAGDEESFRISLLNAPGNYREVVKSGFAELLRSRSLSVDEFYEITRSGLEYETEDQVYADIARAYEHLFGEPAPSFEVKEA